MKLAGLALLSVFVCSCAATIQAEQPAPVFAWLDKNAKTFAAMVATLNITPKSFPPNTKGTLLVPSDKAIAEFLQRMHFTEKEFLAKKELVDLVVSYHFIPGYTAKNSSNVPTNPTIAATADENYILKFYKEAGPKGLRVWVEDVQNNTVTLSKEPVVFNRVAIIPIDKVLMSGGYFFSGEDALKYYPQWSDAFRLAEASGFPVLSGKVAEQDITMFVPEDSVVKGAKPYWLSLSKEAQKQQLLYHFARPAMSIPQQLKSGKLPTLSEGRSLVVDVKEKAAGGVPDVTITPEVGAPVKVVIFNIFAGRTILHGVNGSLQANLAPTSPAKTPATPTAAKPSPTAVSGKPSSTTLPAERRPDEMLGHKHLRRLLNSMAATRSGYHGDGGYTQMTANTIAADNTARAINAAASGTIPAKAATTYGSYHAQQASSCYNCRSWY
eukprot:GHUV01000102.1.p1 GENE.GHUV01000102.1~~GHUV01000102.1.p1  ORF type:complete len:439 (+),score=109.93 GHUV01000102.1:125-1441(+)